MPRPGQIKITASWPTGVPMAFSVLVSNDLTTPTTAPVPGNSTTYADLTTYVDSARVQDYGAYEFVTMRESAVDGFQEWFFAAPLAGQDAYNYEFFNDGEYRWPRLKQTWLVKRSSVTTLTTAVTAPPALGRTWTVFSNKLLRTSGFGPDMFVMDSLYVIYEVEYESATTALTGSEIDALTGSTMAITTERVANGTAGTSVQSGGSYAEIKPENDRWAIKITRYVTTLTNRTLNVVVNYSWPPVLTGISLYAVTINAFPGVRYLVNPYYASGGYDGPCTATILETWSSSNPSAVSITPMIPTPVRYDGMFFSVSERSCLHPSFNFQESASNSTYVGNFINNVSVAATNYTAWPATIVAKVDVDSYRGGFIQRKLTISKPA